MTDYGRDLSCVSDLSYSLAEVRDSRLGVAQAIGRRLQSVLWYDPEYGYDMRRLISAASTPDTDGQIAARVEEEALKDERVRLARAKTRRELEALYVDLQIVTYEDGPFELTLTVTQLEVKALIIE